MPSAVPPPPPGNGDLHDAEDTSTTATGSHRAFKPPKKRRRLPVPAVLGVAALIASGVGVVQSSGDEPTSLTAEPSTLSTPLTPPDDAFERSNGPDISRDISRETLDRQATTQQKQREQALAELKSQSQDRSKELLKAQKKREKEEAQREKEEAQEDGQAASAEGSDDGGDDGGDTASGNQWVLPVAGYSLTATFGETSSYWETIHTGLDFAAGSGTPLVAVSSGTITSAGYDGAYGNKTVLTLDDGTEIWYCHQTSIEVSSGEEVAPGDQIGTVGATGNVTGPHLHLEVRPGGGEPVDPAAELEEHGVTP